MKLICMFNGPPNIGKDVLAEILRFDLGLGLEDKYTLAREVISQASIYLGLDDEFSTHWNVPGYKDNDHILLGQTPRRAVLDYSKKFVADKPFNSICLPVFRSIKTSSIITDIGFQRDYDTFKELEKDGFKVVVVQLAHPDFEYRDDDRYYVEVDEKHLLSFNVTRGDVKGDSEKLLNLILERKNAHSL